MVKRQKTYKGSGCVLGEGGLMCKLQYKTTCIEMHK